MPVVCLSFVISLTCLVNDRRKRLPRPLATTSGVKISIREFRMLCTVVHARRGQSQSVVSSLIIASRNYILILPHGMDSQTEPKISFQSMQVFDLLVIQVRGPILFVIANADKSTDKHTKRSIDIDLSLMHTFYRYTLSIDHHIQEIISSHFPCPRYYCCFQSCSSAG